MITLPPEFESDIQGQNLNLFPIVTIDTSVPDPFLAYGSGIILSYGMPTDFTSFQHNGSESDFSVGDYVKIEDEYMRVTDIGISLGQLYAEVTRGLLGSNITSHAANSSIYYVPTIKFNISTKDVTLSDTHYKPLLLNIPSIKESMDFENRNYKISNVTLKVSNYEYDGERFSDYAGNLINDPVYIFWVSQSEGILEVYKGFVRRYSHDDETCTIQLEDSTQKDLHADVPVARLGDEDEISNKYKLKPIPMVYGHVDRSPCVLKSSAMTYEDSDIQIIQSASIIIDSQTLEHNLIEETLSNTTFSSDGLYIYDADTHLAVPKVSTLVYGSEPQWTTEEDINTPEIQLLPLLSGNADAKNLIAEGNVEILNIETPTSMSKRADEFYDNGAGLIHDGERFVDGDNQSFMATDAFTGMYAPNYNVAVAWYITFNLLNYSLTDISNTNNEVLIKFNMGVYPDSNNDWFGNNYRLRLNMDGDFIGDITINNAASYEFDNGISTIGVGTFSLGSAVVPNYLNMSKIQWGYSADIDAGFIGEPTAVSNGELNRCVLKRNIAIEGFMNKVFYANVNGRTLEAYESIET